VPLALHALARLRQQTWCPAEVAMINANRNLDAYAKPWARRCGPTPCPTSPVRWLVF
jgi:hypothetical protein